VLIDAHDSPVRDHVWRLYREVIARRGRTPTLIEWDNEVPQWPVLLDEARRADAIMAEGASWRGEGARRHAV
jgi:uncharacterized protein (UPF0276 family)